MPFRVLVVDDEEPFRRLLKKELARKGFAVETAPNGDEALVLLREQSFDIILLDLVMPGMDGLGLMKRLRQDPSMPAIIVLTGKATVQTAVEAMKNGAFDYLTKPYKFDELEMVINRACEFGRLEKKTEALKQGIVKQSSSEEITIIGASDQVMELKKLVKKIAPSDSTVLITGESGTGKELVARSIWKQCKRSSAPYMALNCATLSEHLIESELFGHERGAFTTAYKTKYGIVEVTDQGTLLLDEIGEMPMGLQVKLLRFLDSGEFRRVGGTKTLTSSVRLLAATNRDLYEAVKDGSFREDLYYRLNVINIHVPPLRERIGDIPALAEGFIRKYSASMGKAVKGIEESALKRLMSYDWPGNIRELENEIERGVILSEGGAIRTVDLSIPLKAAATELSGIVEKNYPQLDDMERDYIGRVLKETNGNQSQASRILGINRKTLYLKLKKYGLE